MVCPPRGHVFIWCDDFYGNFPFGCRGEHCSPAAFTRCIANAGMAARAVNDRPYGVVIFYCPVGRGDPTPPGCLADAAKLHGTVKTVPYKQPKGKVSSGKMQISGRFVGDA